MTTSSTWGGKLTATKKTLIPLHMFLVSVTHTPESDVNAHNDYIFNVSAMNLTGCDFPTRLFVFDDE